MVAKDLTTGYYRFTDIAWEWYKAFENPKHMDAINAFLAKDAMVHPDHPFRTPGDSGVELWIVTLYNGESRLCFSSAQVEYARYYVKAVGLVDILLPLPSSHYLISKSTINSVSPIYYEEAKAMKKDVSRISKNNKKLKNTADPRLASLRLVFDHIRAAWLDQNATWVALDFEAWEMYHHDLTEFGYAMIRFHERKQVESEEEHWIVLERQHLRNSKYLVDNKDNYEFGDSILVRLKDFSQNIRSLFSRFHALPGPLFLVFHDATGDIKYLREQLGVPEAKVATRMIPDTPPKQGIYIVDTAELFAALEGHSDGGDRRGLERMCRLLGFRQLKHMHNAGNDAHWTLAALQSMASGQPLDMQREERWPAQTETTKLGLPGVKVVRKPWEVDSDYDDMEGMFPDASLGEPAPQGGDDHGGGDNDDDGSEQDFAG